MNNQKGVRDYVFVGIQAVLFGLYFYYLQFSPLEANLPTIGGLGLAAIGSNLIVMAILQLRTTLSPFPTPVADGQLITTGVYSLARHPIYVGVLLMGVGYAWYAHSSLHYLLTLALAILFYFKSSYEEKLLLSVYPEYAAYRQRVGRFLPWSFTA
ncbi:isoprenylcysteine carboxylmethyltransferase family protein [Lewinella sp. 4G2]|uniref:methyltransferase family protein n=1 Tax=Lewinella sp. 4G2 TaxID=1803372 RepID=UPI0007B4B791|nr:isoprenylcysteine carboxylmethyltransferase family protein [Lewinella sp. 4G2]OAV42688.1 hypothetical protein A3850_015715 [Lewinella sp. 4G2]